MSEIKAINGPVPKGLEKFVNEKGILEIVVREKNKKFKEFPRVMFNQLSENEGTREAVNQLAKLVKDNAKINAENLKRLQNIAKVGNVNLLLNGANLFATSAGFAIIYAKLDALSKEIDKELKKIQKNIKDIQDIQAGHQFNDVVSNYMNMLDCKKKNKPYTEEQLRELIDDENNLLRMMISVLDKDVSNDNRQLIISIVSMASMMAATLNDFDEVYYFNNKETVSNNERWHISHQKWMSTYETLSSEWFIKKLQDHALFDLRLGTRETDVFCDSIVENVDDMSQGVRDNMDLIQRVDERNALSELRDFIDQEARNEIQSMIEEVSIGPENPALKKACQVAVQAIG